MNIFIAGLGYCGAAIAERLEREGHGVWGLNRSGRSPRAGIRAVAGDVLRPDSLASLAALPPMGLMICALSGSGQADPAAYRAIYVEGPRRVADALAWAGPRRLWFLGSTGVYGGEDGGWVDEGTPVDPGHIQGEVQVEAEAAARAASDECCVLRLSGLYGPGRTRMLRQALRKRPFPKPEVWANQIHRDDVAGVVAQVVAAGARPPPTLLVSDDLPSLRRDVLDWMRREAGAPEGLWDEDHPAAVSRGRGNKRVSNRLLRSLGLGLEYPDYRAGYAGLIASLSAGCGRISARTLPISSRE